MCVLVAVFTLEYVIRIVAARNLCVFFWDILNLIDFAAVLPFWMELALSAFGGGNAGQSNALRVIRVVRLARVFRLMKTPRFADYMAILKVRSLMLLCQT